MYGERRHHCRCHCTVRTSRAAPHPAVITIRALCHLTSELERDPNQSTRPVCQRESLWLWLWLRLWLWLWSCAYLLCFLVCFVFVCFVFVCVYMLCVVVVFLCVSVCCCVFLYFLCVSVCCCVFLSVSVCGCGCDCGCGCGCGTHGCTLGLPSPVGGWLGVCRHLLSLFI